MNSKSNDNVTTISKGVTTILILCLLLTACSLQDVLSVKPVEQQIVTTIPTVPEIVVTSTPAVTPIVTTIPEYVVTVDALEVRSGAGENNLNVGYLKRGDVVQVYEIATVTGETCKTWARIAPAKWACFEKLSPE